ncbi:NADP-dependent malate dehydrogenase [Zopfochytrium polystomum]|nr:NADP-dependent malate dehydrogenase [Zopfochytrium polystomum]
MGSGLDVIKLQHINESTAFPSHLRTSLKLRGLLPPSVETLPMQVERCLARLRSIKDPLEQFAYLDRIRSEDTTLFYALVAADLSGIVGIIYTPTVGRVCQMFSRIYSPGSVNGLFISLQDKNHLDEILENWTFPSPDIAVMTDGSRILGLGDLGINGMGIPIGKLSLYTAAAGVNPSRTLPITLDVGCNTQEHLRDPFYLGSRKKRPDDDVFFAFTDAVMAALKRRWPDLLIQFEDFSSEHAFQLLDRYRNKYFCFNDDIQGTGAVILAGFINAVKLSGIALRDHRILFVGAGSAGVGVASQLREYFVKEGGLTVDEATKMFWLMDSKGLLTSDRSDATRYPEHKTIFMRKDMGGKQISELEEAVKFIKPTALIGLSSVGGAFTEAILTTMKDFNKHPIVFPLSNPLTNAECTFEDAMKFTNGTVLFASGTAFPPCPHPVSGKVIEPGQGNNMYIFPALGLGGILSKATRVTDDMVYRSAVSLADTLNEDERASGLLYPRIERIRSISAVIARDVVIEALKEVR